jgi:2-polyprenyl-6-hydroxyphenyl methylase/3-demethylubiquinone-9 3-methyltransferase
MRIFDLGCGNGSVAAALAHRGFEVIGVDPSEQGITEANRQYPGLHLSVASAYDDLTSHYGRFPVVISLEVVEHLYFPRRYAQTIFDLLEPGGRAIVSTPYHGYWKNLILAAAGKMDAHFTALWDHGHIKFWSVATLRTLLREAGFSDVRFTRVGRIPILAKSMVATATKPMR